MKLLLNPEFNLYEKNGQVFCDSLQIAETFQKRHDNVIATIENQFKNATDLGVLNFKEANFIKTTYKDSQKKNRPMYLLTRDGFSYTVMGFTGEKAAIFKIGFINRFNAMEEFIKSLLATKIEFPAFTDAIMDTHEEPKHYHLSNEINMIYRIVLGCDAKKFRELNGLEKGVVIKPYLNTFQIKAIEELQRTDIGLLEMNLDFEQRKRVLINKFNKLLLKKSA